MCKVSICIPAYGNPEGIHRLLDSIAGQTYTDFEIIITDDSPDDSVKKIVEAEATCAGTKIDFNQKLKYYKNPQRLGASENWNHSMELSNGEYIKMMHHDDWFTDQNSLKQFVDMLDGNPDAILAFSGSRQVDLDKKGAFYDRHISPKDAEELSNDIYYLYISQCIGAPSATIYRKNSLKYDGELTWLMDAEYYMHLMQVVPEKRRKKVFTYTTSPLVSIGTSSAQLTEAVGQDGEINVYEYGYIMKEFDLGNPDNELLENTKLSSADNAYRYRNKLISKAVEFKQPYSTIKKYGIPKEEYKEVRKKKQKEDILFYRDLIARKLLRI